jgi:3',5'-cyclic-AMP phosphodiesterase
MSHAIDRRTFLKQLTAVAAASTVPMSLAEVVWGAEREQRFTFAYICDAHMTQIKGRQFTSNFEDGLRRAVREVNALSPAPDFVVFGGDLAQMGKREELDYGLEIMSALDRPVRWVIGEHDYYLDLGKYWQEKVSPLHYSFEHKGVHFVVLNSILSDDNWTHQRWPSAEERMRQAARFDNPQASPYRVGKEQRRWLAADLVRVQRHTPVVVLSHAPLYKIFRPWNMWTEDAEQVQALLQPFHKVTVLHGHVHQLLYHQIGHITFYGMMSTAWPWPYPVSDPRSRHAVPKLTVFMNRGDPSNFRDGTGWGHLDLADGHFVKHYELWENTPRVVRFDEKLGHPVDTQYRDKANRILAQNHY